MDKLNYFLVGGVFGIVVLYLLILIPSFSADVIVIGGQRFVRAEPEPSSSWEGEWKCLEFDLTEVGGKHLTSMWMVDCEPGHGVRIRVERRVSGRSVHAVPVVWEQGSSVLEQTVEPVEGDAETNCFPAGDGCNVTCCDDLNLFCVTTLALCVPEEVMGSWEQRGLEEPVLDNNFGVSGISVGFPDFVGIECSEGYSVLVDENRLGCKWRVSGE